MRTLIILLDIVILVPFLFFSLYLALLSLLAMTRRLRHFDNPPDEHRQFAILVPAHNEETVLEKTLQSLKAIDYPNNLFDILVIVDNCTDNTASISRAMGANTYERFDAEKIGKGHALRWCMDELLDSKAPYDAFVVIDADTVVSTNLLTVMNAYLAEGAECIQCSDMVVPQPGVWSPEITRVAFILHNYVRPLGKLAVGWSSGLNGNGMCFSRQHIETRPWNTYSRVEDLEHSLQLALNNIRVQFAPEAVVHAIMPSNPKNAETQRRRWEIGRFPLILSYVKPLIAKAARLRSTMILDSLVDLLTPAFMNLFELTCVIFFLHIIAISLGASWLYGLSGVWGLVLALGVFHVIGGLKAAHADRNAYFALLNTPKYAYWKLRLYAKTLLKGDDKGWVRTARENGK